ncbi:MAG: hypothetical protein OEZ68_12515 [Gammaproteobacteria bacterium]|nr:hypothetical protein [Gammaproteobacteria bacterium]MDH5801619.1 hypothetical protein [Gammaproteobacteria bacterium]
MNTVQTETQIHQAPGWLVLQLGRLDFAIPKKDAKFISLIAALDTKNHESVQVGRLKYNDREWPVYNINHRMELDSELPEQRRFCILLSHQNNMIGLVCDQITMLAADDDLMLQDIPDFSIQENSPLRRMGQYMEKMISASAPGELAFYLSELEVAHA